MLPRHAHGGESAHLIFQPHKETNTITTQHNNFGNLKGCSQYNVPDYYKKFIKAINTAHIILFLDFLFIYAHTRLSTCICQYLFENFR